MREPVYPGYLADPFLAATHDGFIVYGTGDPAAGGTFDAIHSRELREWQRVGDILERPEESLGTDFWAPEVVFDDGRYWMFYSVGHGIIGHHIRVASSSSALGPFVDEGVDLTPGESFAIDAHPFRDADGSWYLFFARDVLESPTPGTHLAVVRLSSMLSTLGPVLSTLSPYASWQIYEHDRLMYGQRRDWYTLEGPNVVLREGTYTLFYSGGSWEGPNYGVAYATAPTPLGPWKPQGGPGPTVLNSSQSGLAGPGHNSVLAMKNGEHLIAYHAWDRSLGRRQTHINPLHWIGEVPTPDVNHTF